MPRKKTKNIHISNVRLTQMRLAELLKVNGTKRIDILAGFTAGNHSRIVVIVRDAAQQKKAIEELLGLNLHDDARVYEYLEETPEQEDEPLYRRLPRVRREAISRKKDLAFRFRHPAQDGNQEEFSWVVIPARELRSDSMNAFIYPQTSQPEVAVELVEAIAKIVFFVHLTWKGRTHEVHGHHKTAQTLEMLANATPIEEEPGLTEVFLGCEARIEAELAKLGAALAALKTSRQAHEAAGGIGLPPDVKFFPESVEIPVEVSGGRSTVRLWKSHD
jgi:hypothetical protein